MNKGPYAIRVRKYGQWVYVGPVYRTKKLAMGWKGFVQAAHRGLPTQVISQQQAEAEKIGGAK